MLIPCSYQRSFLPRFCFMSFLYMLSLCKGILELSSTFLCSELSLSSCFPIVGSHLFWSREYRFFLVIWHVNTLLWISEWIRTRQSWNFTRTNFYIVGRLFHYTKVLFLKDFKKYWSSFKKKEKEKWIWEKVLQTTSGHTNISEAWFNNESSAAQEGQLLITWKWPGREKVKSSMFQFPV